MYLVVNKKKIELKELTTFHERFKSLKFNLYVLDYALVFPKKRMLDTTFYCQRVDACFTDEHDTIMYLHSNVKSEKSIVHLKAKKLYVLPLNTVQYLKVGETLNIKK